MQKRDVWAHWGDEEVEMEMERKKKSLVSLDLSGSNEGGGKRYKFIWKVELGTLTLVFSNPFVKGWLSTDCSEGAAYCI